MSHRKSRPSRSTPELRMMWYPHLQGGSLTQERIDEALRQARMERAEMLAAIASGIFRLFTRGTRALLRGLSRTQERRAGTALSHYRGAMDERVPAGDRHGAVCQVLSHPESAHNDDRAGEPRDPGPRLAA